MKRTRYITAVLLIFAMIISQSACGNNGGRDTTKITYPTFPTTGVTEETEKPSQTETTSAQIQTDDAQWTILIYVCGSDLESQGSMATVDIEEMLEADTGSNVRFVIETGGAARWEHRGSSSKRLDRFVITGGREEYLGSAETKNMGTEGALEEFLVWAAKNYESEHMGLILWDHGSGSINGVCFDENYNNDSLLLKDISKALASASRYMDDKFDFIGFDACMMSTLESAIQLAPYAEYMVGSQEIEPGYGWDYRTIGDYLGRAPATDAVELGKVICDSFYAACRDIGEEDSCTLAVTDLKRIDDVVAHFDRFAQDLYNATGDTQKISAVIRTIYGIDSFGANNEIEGYTNMVDLGEMIDAGRIVSDNAIAARKAVDNVVLYQVRGSEHSNACGLSTYYPILIQGSQELKIFQNICASTYYVGFVDKIANGLAYGGEIDEYDNYDIAAGIAEPEWEGVDDVQTGESPLISFTYEPQLDEEGTFWFQLSPDGLNNAVAVEAMVFLLSDDYEDAICMGLSTDVLGDWETGYFCDNFDGYWFALDDGQVLCSYLAETGDGYDVFTAPILLNGEEKCLRFIWDYGNTGEVTMIDVWDGISDYGAPGKIGNPLSIGDVITPLYDAFVIDTGEEFYYYGDDYIYNGDDNLWFDKMPDGDYFYSFVIDDIYGDFYTSQLAVMTIEGEDIYFLDELY